MKESKRYIVYKTLTRQVHKSIVKLDKSFKKKTPYQAFKKIHDFDINFVNSIDFSIYAEELFWRDEGSKILFPGNEFFFNNLYGADMKIEDASAFNLPFSSFIVSVPSGLELQGRSIPSFQVNFLDHSTYNETVLDPFIEQCDIPRPKVISEKHEPGKRMLSINYPSEGLDKTGRVRFMEMEDRLPKFLNAKSFSEMKAVSMPMKGKHQSIDLDDRDLELQYILLKLIASIGVYYTAKGESSVVPGIPDVKGVSIDRGAEYKPLSFKFANGYVAPKTQSEHVRGWSFRQLRHEKYYKGEYKDAAPGSRVVFVDSYIAGTKSDPYLIKES